MAIMIDDLIPGNSEQPGGKTAILPEAIQGFQGSQEGLGGQILGLLCISNPTVEVAINPLDIQLVDLAEPGGILPDGEDKISLSMVRNGFGGVL
jgi:hypothetical protein